MNYNKDVPSEEDVVNILRLIRSENVGNRTFIDLVNLFGSAKEAIKHVEEFSLKGGRSKPIKLYSLDKAYLEIENIEKHKSKFITYNHPSYSKLLLNIDDYPPFLTYKGNIEFMNRENIVAIVGSRNASANSQSFAANLSKELAKNDYILVSGFARGIDGKVHINAKNNTIVVLPGGIDVVYPAEHKKLYDEISETGLIISEQKVSTQILAQFFPMRNRIVSGISKATIVIEAKLASGSLITAKTALDQNRDVFAVPGFPADPRSKGANKLIKEGAFLLETYQDILDHFSFQKQIVIDNKIHKINNNSNNFGKINETTKDLMKNNRRNITNDVRVKISDMISYTPVEYEFIADNLQIDLDIIYTVCLELELAGKIQRHNGNKISRIYSDLS